MILTRLLCMLVGIRKDAIDRAPNAMGQPVIFAVLLIGTSTIAGSMATYAIRRIFYENPWSWLIAIAGGLVWACVVFAIDRSMLNLDKRAPLRKLVVQVAARLVLAVAVGLSISKPTFLRVARSPIDLGIRVASRAEIDSEARDNARIEKLPEREQNYSTAQEQEKSAREALAVGPGSSPNYVSAVHARDAEQERNRRILNRYGPEIEQAQQQLAAMPEEARAESPLAKRIQRLQLLIQEVAASLKRANSAVAEAEIEWRRNASDALTSATQYLGQAKQASETADAKVERENDNSRAEVNRLTKPDLATEYTRAGQIIADPSNPYSSSLRAIRMLFDALFVMLEMLIVSIKVLSPESEMDRAVKTLEAEEQEAMRIESEARIKRLEKAAETTRELMDEVFDLWKEQKLEEMRETEPFSTSVLMELLEECEELVDRAA